MIASLRHIKKCDIRHLTSKSKDVHDVEFSMSHQIAVTTLLDIFSDRPEQERHWLRQTLLELFSNTDDWLLPIRDMLSQGRVIAAAEALFDLAEQHQNKNQPSSDQFSSKMLAQIYRYAAALFLPLIHTRAITALKKALCVDYDCSDIHKMLAYHYQSIGHCKTAQQHLLQADRFHAVDKLSDNKLDSETAEHADANTPTIFTKSLSTVQNLPLTPLKFSQAANLKPLKFIGKAELSG